MNIMHHATSSDFFAFGNSFALHIEKINSHRYLWFGISDKREFVYEANTFAELAKHWPDNRITIDFLIDRISFIDKRFCHAQALYINGHCIAKSDNLGIIEE